MADSSAIPAGVDPSELYDGPAVVPFKSGKATLLAPDPAELVKPTPAPQPAPPAPPAPVQVASEVSQDAKEQTEYARVITLALDVLAARTLGIIALVTGCLLWGYVVVDPVQMRIIAASCFSLTVFGPVMWIYFRHGQAR